MNKANPSYIYLVDDDASFRSSLNGAFVSLGYQVKTFASAEEFLGHPDIAWPAVLISDMRMPGIDGLSFIRKAREVSDSIPYYLLTAFSYDQEIEKAIEDKVVRKAFTKPLDASVITAEFGY